MKILFPTILISLQFCAGVVYGVYGDVKNSAYWIVAAILNSVVTYL